MNRSKAAELIINSSKTTVFTGAGISVESGIPPFRGEAGLWSQYDPIILDINYYLKNYQKSWPIIKELFYDYFGKSKPNQAHQILAKWEEAQYIDAIITQNIDCLHQKAGSKNVYEFHGTSESFVCTKCQTKFKSTELELSETAPRCPYKTCEGLLKPNFIFFGEGIPESAYTKSINAAHTSELFIIVGTTGEIMPASQIPYLAKQNNSVIIEVNIQPSNFTNKITDIFLQGKATEIFEQLDLEINSLLTK
jgi:NAD-dependent deacetylase